MDEIRSRVVNELIRDAARPRKALAAELGISESYISKIIKEYVQTEIIDRFTIHLNYERLHYNNHAFSIIKLKDISASHLKEFAANIASHNEAVEVYTIFGEYDIFVRWVCQNPESIMENIDSVLSAEDVQSIQTFTLGKKYKRTYGPLVSKD